MDSWKPNDQDRHLRWRAVSISRFLFYNTQKTLTPSKPPIHCGLAYPGHPQGRWHSLQAFKRVVAWILHPAMPLPLHHWICHLTPRGLLSQLCIISCIGCHHKTVMILLIMKIGTISLAFIISKANYWLSLGFPSDSDLPGFLCCRTSKVSNRHTTKFLYHFFVFQI